MTVSVGDLHIQCPECHEEIRVSVSARLVTDDDDRQSLALDPDMADLWSHAWSHET